MENMKLSITKSLRETIAPSGTLRASINIGNPILAGLDNNNKPVGVSIDLANELSNILDIPIELVVHTSAGKSVETVNAGGADFGFFAIDPVRGANLNFTDPYILIEGAYLVNGESPITDNSQVDSHGVRIMVGKGSAYDLHLSREIKHASLLRAPTSPEVVDYFVKEKVEVAAGVKQQLEQSMTKYPNLRLLPGRFMVIRQAIGIHKDKGPHAHEFLQKFVRNAIDSGFVYKAMEKHNIQGASVAS